MHLLDPKTWDVARLAEQYKIRQQRVMAILALKKLQQQHLNQGKTRSRTSRRRGRRSTGARTAARASDTCASSPSSRGSRSCTRTRPRRSSTRFCRGTRAAEAKAEKEERVLIRRFRDNLAYNMRETAPSLNRRGRIRRPHARPAGGWGLMVVPMVESNSKKTHARQARGVASRGGRAVRRVPGRDQARGERGRKDYVRPPAIAAVQENRVRLCARLCAS